MFKNYTLDEQIHVSNSDCTFVLSADISKDIHTIYEKYDESVIGDTIEPYLNLDDVDGKTFIYTKPQSLIDHYYELNKALRKYNRKPFACYELKLENTLKLVRLAIGDNGIIAIPAKNQSLRIYRLLDAITGEDASKTIRVSTRQHTARGRNCLVDYDCEMSPLSQWKLSSCLTDSDCEQQDYYAAHIYDEFVECFDLKLFDRVFFADNPEVIFEGYFLEKEITKEVLDYINSEAEIRECIKCGNKFVQFDSDRRICNACIKKAENPYGSTSIFQ